MAKYLSPGNYFVEVDISDYPAGINSSVVGIVGFASKGPTAGKGGKKATLITSQENLINTFGQPSEGIAGQGIEGGLEILESTNSMYYIRCAAASALEASAAAPMGACPAMNVCTTPHGGYIGLADVGSRNYRFTVTTYDNARSKVLNSKVYNVPSGTLTLSAGNGGTSIDSLRKVLGGSLDADRIGIFGTDAATSAFLVNPIAGSGASMEVTMEDSTDGTTFTATQGLRPLDLSGQASGAVAVAQGTIQVSGGTFTNLYYWTRSLFTGAGYNEGTTPAGNTSGTSIEVSINGNSNSVIQVNTNGTALETFKGGATSSVFLEGQIGKTNANATSQEIVGFFTSSNNNAVGGVGSINNFFDQADGIGNQAAYKFSVVGGTGLVDNTSSVAADPRFIKLVQGTYSLSGGNNGIPTDTGDQETLLIGQVESDGGRSGIEALDDEDVPVKIALVPNFSELDGAQNALITKAEAMKSFIALVSPPYAIGKPQDAIDWTNGKSSDRTTSINSSYAACYWPWVKTFSVFDGKDRWYAPEIWAARQMCVTDSVARPWFAPAGLQRGRLTKPVDVEVVLNQGDRDSLYSGGNIINPITKFSQDGLVIFGQRTALRTNKATNRVNIRRLLIDLRDSILLSTRQFAFEPNDRFTWDQVTNVVAPLLDDIRRERGITEFKVVCDETTNTPVRVDRNELWCKVLLKPTKTAEVIVFEINITNQSAQIGN
jgi:phage tail sheath protein FI